MPTVVSYSSLQQLPAEQIVDIPVPGRRGLQGSRPGQGSAASSSHSRGAADEAFAGVLALFPKIKKARLGPHSGVGIECGL